MRALSRLAQLDPDSQGRGVPGFRKTNDESSGREGGGKHQSEGGWVGGKSERTKGMAGLYRPRQQSRAKSVAKEKPRSIEWADISQIKDTPSICFLTEPRWQISPRTSE